MEINKTEVFKNVYFTELKSYRVDLHCPECGTLMHYINDNKGKQPTYSPGNDWINEERDGYHHLCECCGYDTRFNVRNGAILRAANYRELRNKIKEFTGKSFKWAQREMIEEIIRKQNESEVICL